MLYRRSLLSRSPFTEQPLAAGSRRWLIRELDITTSRIVRTRDRNCVICGSTRRSQCSHFYSRRHLNTRFDLRNCNAMCGPCNLRHNRDPSPYLHFMEGHYGLEVMAELSELRMSLRKLTDDDLIKRLSELKTISR